MLCVSFRDGEYVTYVTLSKIYVTSNVRGLKIGHPHLILEHAARIKRVASPIHRHVKNHGKDRHMVHHQAKLDKASSRISQPVPFFGGEWGEWVRGAKSQVSPKQVARVFLPQISKYPCIPLSLT